MGFCQDRVRMLKLLLHHVQAVGVEREEFIDNQQVKKEEGRLRN
jgi:hypothetical protein